MKACLSCKRPSPFLGRNFPFCKECILRNFELLRNFFSTVHIASRKKYGLPPAPQSSEGVKCLLCARECVIPEGGRGFCGLRYVKEGKLLSAGGTPSAAFLDYYYDPLPTNCVADWVCRGHTRYGFYNLAVFYKACNLNCLFCQNYHFRFTDFSSEKPISAEEMIKKLHKKTFCVCFFGGDPSPQVAHALYLGKRLFEEKGIVVCFETNGLFNLSILEKACQLVKASGGKLKFDIKAFSPELYYSLTSYDGKKVFENFQKAAEFLGTDLCHEFLVASTLLVPGIIDAEEVGKIAAFIASINPQIPYALLAFAPHAEMKDFPTTPFTQAQLCYDAALKSGLKRVRLGNVFLLS